MIHPPSHVDQTYQCPFCDIVAGRPGPLTTPDEVVAKNEDVTAFIAARQLRGCPGHALVVPNDHFENLYDLPDRLAAGIVSLTRRVALALRRTPGCEGISLRQHNEPVGGQDVFHFHVHVYPRFPGDGYFGEPDLLVPDVADRIRQAEWLRHQLAD